MIQVSWIMEVVLGIYSFSDQGNHCPFNCRNYRNSIEVSAAFISAPANQPPHPLPCVCYVSWFLLAQLLHPHGFCSLTSSPARMCLFCISLLVRASTITARHLSFNSRENVIGPQVNGLTVHKAVVHHKLKQQSLLFCLYGVLWGKYPQIIYFQKLK